MLALHRRALPWCQTVAFPPLCASRLPRERAETRGVGNRRRSTRASGCFSLPATDDFQVLAAMQHMCIVAEQQRGRRAQPALPPSAFATDEMQSQPCRRGRKTCSRGPLMTFCTAEPRPCVPARMFRLSLEFDSLEEAEHEPRGRA